MRMTSMLFFTALALLVAAPMTTLAQDITTIAHAKRDLDGDFWPDDTASFVELRGRVTSPDYARTVGSTTFIEVYLQDPSDNAGISLLFNPSPYPEYPAYDWTEDASYLALGHEVRIQGHVSQTNGLRFIQPSPLSLNTGGILVTDTNPVHPAPVPETITNLLQNAEDYEGTLVVVSNVTYTGTWPDFGANGFLTADDGTASMDLFIDRDTGIDGQLPPTTNAFVLQGIFSQFDSTTNNLPNGPNENYQILPRYYTDIIQDGVPADAPPSLTLSPEGTVMAGVGAETTIHMLGQDQNAADVLVFGKASGMGTVTDLGGREAEFVWTPPAGSELTTNMVTLTVSDGLTSVSDTVAVVVEPIPTNFWNFEGWLQGWTTYSAASTAEWVMEDDDYYSPGAEGSTNYMFVSGYRSDTASDDWLISPALDLSSYSFPAISYYDYSYYNGPLPKLWVSTDYPGTGNPYGYTWTDLGLTEPPAWGAWYQETQSLAAYAGIDGVYVAFQYTSDGPASGDGRDFRIDQVRLEDSPANVPPVFSPPLVNMGVVAGGTVQFATRAIEPNNDLVQMTVVGKPATASYSVTNDLGEGTGFFSWTPGEADAGVATVSFVATDVDGAGTNDVEITVASANRPCGLIISEYIEGSGQNKAIELYNGTPYEIDLAAEGYVLDRYNNGSTGINGSTILDGRVASGGTYLIVNSDPATSATLTNAADQFGAMWFNGDDALVLRKGPSGNREVVDSIGRVGEDPGTAWGTLPITTVDQTLVRKASVKGGDIVFDDAFDPADEYTSSGTLDDFSNIQMHVSDGCPEEGDYPPMITVPGPQTAIAGDTVTFEVTATEPDGDAITMWESGKPATALFTDNGSGTGTFTWVTTLADTGMVTVTFSATDKDGTDDDTVEITVVAPSIGGEGLIISEVVDGTLGGGNPKFVEITNTGDEDYTFGGGGIVLQSNDATDYDIDVDLTGITILAGESFVIQSQANGGSNVFYDTYGFDADLYTAAYFSNGDDRYILADADDGAGVATSFVDIHGEDGVDGTGAAWEYTDGYAYRLPDVVNGKGLSFDIAEWFHGGVNSLETGDDAEELVLLQTLTSPGTHHFGSGPVDTDGDGMSDEDELFADTDPSDPNSLFSVIGIVATPAHEITLGSTSTARVYQLEYTTDINDPNSWTDLAPAVTGTEPVTVITDSAVDPDRNYRGKVMLP